ncbi:MAG: stage V sporulation protein D [Erysipelotrichaceae bacterium]|nr:stage V sporulation protein D [Erysipelotrichaceae bacterium]
MLARKQKRRVRILLVSSLLIFGCILMKLADLQLIHRDFYTSKAEDLWQRDFDVAGLRGSILDRNGNVLAIDMPSTSVIAVPSQIENLEETIQVLSDILNKDEESLRAQLTKKVSSSKILPEGKLIDAKQAAQIESAQLPGIVLVQDSLRTYPKGSYLAQVLGFTGSDNQGLAGLELQYDEILNAHSGSMKIPYDAKGHPLTIYEEEYIAPGQGIDLVLTIDTQIQDVLERECNNAMAKYDCDSVWALAMDPDTGEILAMVSKPDFDPNNYQEASQEVINRNLPVWKSYEPGSTFKTVTYSAALEEQLFDQFKDTYYDKGYELVEGARLKSWKAGGHGLQTYVQCLQNSSNPCFVNIAQNLGKENMLKYLALFNFGTKTKVDLPGESTGILFDEDEFDLLEMSTTGFGQGISVTAIQLTSAFCAMVNGGTYYQPYITKAMLHPTTKDILFEVKPNAVRQVISEQTSLQMRAALETVVAYGGAKSGYVYGWKTGGKTGTAQKAVNGQYLVGEYILSYIVAAPIDDPEIVIYMALDAPENDVQYGGTVVAPIVKSALEDILTNMNVPKSQTQLKKTQLWSDPIMIEIEDYIGKKKKECRSSDLNIEFYGEGDTVIDQIPGAKTVVEQYSTIWLYLGNEQ